MSPLEPFRWIPRSDLEPPDPDETARRAALQSVLWPTGRRRAHRAPLASCFTDRRSFREIGGLRAYLRQVAASLWQRIRRPR